MDDLAGDLAAVEVRLREILMPYEGRLEWATIYGNRALRRPGAKAHDWFAFVKPASRHVSLYLMPVHTRPELLESISPALRQRQTGKTTFGFRAIDDAEMAELEHLVARAFEAYIAVT